VEQAGDLAAGGWAPWWRMNARSREEAAARANLPAP